MKRTSLVLTVGGVVAALVLMRACTRDRITWKEEVTLHDGKVLIVTRAMTMNSGRFEPGAYMLGERQYRLEFMAPNGEKVVWSNKGDLRPMILDFSEGKPYMAAQPAMITDYKTYDCPHPPYVFLVFDGDWRRIPFEQFPYPRSEMNLSPSTSRRAQLARHGELGKQTVTFLVRALDEDTRHINTKRYSPSGPCPEVNIIK